MNKSAANSLRRFVSNCFWKRSFFVLNLNRGFAFVFGLLDFGLISDLFCDLWFCKMIQDFLLMIIGLAKKVGAEAYWHVYEVLGTRFDTIPHQIKVWCMEYWNILIWDNKNLNKMIIKIKNWNYLARQNLYSKCTFSAHFVENSHFQHSNLFLSTSRKREILG